MQYKDPESLLAALPRITPLDNKVFLTQGYLEEKVRMVDGRRCEPYEWGQKTWTKEARPGHWKMDQAMFNSLEEMQWNQLYNLVDEKQRPKPLGAGELQELNDGLIER